MSNNVDIALIGAGYMGREYSKVLDAQGVSYLVVCRSRESAEKFKKDTGAQTEYGGVEKVFSGLKRIPDKAIVAVSVEQLASVTTELLLSGVKKILVEKPGGLNRREIEEIASLSKEKNAKVYVAYNRRFYASTERAIEIINQDGGVDSFNFEFTEWGNVIENEQHKDIVKEEWLLANSSHVIDLAFFLGGYPIKMSSFSAGELKWHHRASKYSGAGISSKGAIFSYQANWDAPGRWSVELLTKKHRLFFKPMEKLAVQEKGSIKIEEVMIDDTLDISYKPGLYKEVDCFLNNCDTDRLLLIEDQLKHMDFYEKIEGLMR